jgi:hypothetical protein
VKVLIDFENTNDTLFDIKRSYFVVSHYVVPQPKKKGKPEKASLEITE